MCFACTLRTFIPAPQTMSRLTACGRKLGYKPHGTKRLERTQGRHGDPENRPKQAEFLPSLFLMYRVGKNSLQTPQYPCSLGRQVFVVSKLQRTACQQTT